MTAPRLLNQASRDRLEDLRELLHQPPAPEAWARLCDLFLGWPRHDPSLEVGVDYARVGLARWPDALRRAAPGLGMHLVLIDRSGPGGAPRHRFAGLMDEPHPAWSLCRALAPGRLVGGLRVDEVEALAAWRHMAPIRRLDLRRCLTTFAAGDGDRALSALARGPHLENLEALRLTWAGAGPRGVEILARGGGLTRLSHLDLSYNPIGDLGATFLASGERLGRVERLELAGANLGDPGARALGRAHHFGRVTHLNLAHNPIGDGGLVGLLDAPLLAGLRHLDLRHTHLGPEGLAMARTWAARAGVETLLLPDQ